VRLQFGLAGQGDHAAFVGILDRQRRTETLQHALGMVARRFLFDHDGLAGGIQPRQQHGGFDLRRWDRHDIADRHRICRTHQRHRQSPARATDRSRAEQRQRIGHTAHRTAVQGCITGECHRDRRGRHGAHD